MSRHLDKKTKYHYVMRYLNGESPTKLGKEINPLAKSPEGIVIVWSKKYYLEGIKGLKSKSGTKKGKGKGKGKTKKKKKYEDMTKEELIQEHLIKDHFMDILKKDTRPRFIYNAIYLFNCNKFKISIVNLCDRMGVSRSGYYDWIKLKKTENNYNDDWLRIIKNEYYEHKGIYGSERIWGSLKAKNILKVNLKTIKRYMQHLGLKAKIRVPKRKREVKDSSNICKNYINQNFKNDFSRAKLFTDTTQYKFEFGTVYFSGVVGSCKTLFSLNVSFRNDETLIQKDIKEATRKVGRKYIIQFDNAAFYKNKNMIKLIEKTNGIRSYSHPGKCLDNRPIEYQWSILKQEYFKHINPKSLEELKGMLQKILFHYNHVRIQKKLDWKTPAKARV